MQSSEKLNSYTSVRVPEKANPIEGAAKDEWIESFTDERARVLASFLAENINHVSFEQFTKALAESTTKFMEEVGNRPYVILIPRDNKKGVQKSELWVANIAQMATTNSPAAVITDKELRAYLREHPEVKDVALYDDASYTGERLGNSVEIHKYDARINVSLNMHIIVPFMTEQAQALLANKAETTAKDGFSIKTYPSETIKTVNDIVNSAFDEESIPRVKECLKQFFNIDVDYEMEQGYCPALTYFDHKVGDSTSFMESIRKGEVRDEKGTVTKTIQFIPDTIPPYKQIKE